MAADLVHSATSSKLAETDWSKNIAICELVARDHRQAKDVVKAIKKHVGNKHQNVQLYAVMLLEMLMNNIGEPVHKQVVEGGILPALVKIVKKKTDHPVRERIFLLLDAAQTSVGGASGRFPQYYSAYYELVSAGVKFPQRPRDIPKPRSTSNMNRNNPPDNRDAVPEPETNVYQAVEKVSEPRKVLENANSVMEILLDVLDAIDTEYPERAKDDITLEFVEQCSFAKQRVMHLALNTLDETVVTRAVELNEQLERVLRRHYALLDVRVERSIRDAIENQRKEEEREEEEQLIRRLQKGKACAEPEEEDRVRNPFGFMDPIPGNLLRRPLIRPIPTEAPKQAELGARKPAVVIPPPPVNHVERERFFRENRSSDSSGLSDHMRSLSLHSMYGSSSHSGSTDFSDTSR